MAVKQVRKTLTPKDLTQPRVLPLLTLKGALQLRVVALLTPKAVAQTQAGLILMPKAAVQPQAAIARTLGGFNLRRTSTINSPAPAANSAPRVTLNIRSTIAG